LFLVKLIDQNHLTTLENDAVAGKHLDGKYFLLFIFLAVFENLLNILVVEVNPFAFLKLNGRPPLWSADLKEVLLFLLIQELINPVVLALDIGRELLLKEDERMHLSEKLLASGILSLLPEVFTLNFKFKFLCFNLSLTLRLINFG